MHKLMMGLARLMAVAGGIVLSLLILLTCLSIVGRLLNGLLHGAIMQGMAPDLSEWLISIGIGPINGDFEVVEAGVAFAIFAFLPLCQITAGHASVDLVTNSFPRSVKRFLRMLTEIVFAAVLVLIAARLGAGTLSKVQNGETSFLLEFPVWWSYGASLFAACVAALVGTYMAAVRTIEFFTGRILVWDGVEDEQ
ncbi:TRAP transporter small permease [Phaeobacter sp. C3_T13_0]|uniref:TRAP transporter small permease n=1 Tax=Phaeobacter cretensis TaxID=3342641 RepID=UPI0039BD5EFC